jgi:hypothetical protein
LGKIGLLAESQPLTPKTFRKLTPKAFGVIEPQRAIACLS